MGVRQAEPEPTSGGNAGWRSGTPLGRARGERGASRLRARPSGRKADGAETLARTGSKRPKGPPIPVIVGTEGNSKKARTAVTRSGCRRGEFFEGCESVARRRRLGQGSNPQVAEGGKTRRTSDRQRGATNPRPSGGESRQGSAKLRRRNRSRRVAPSARRERRKLAPGSGRPR
jgi:hypothetical protein